MKSTRGVVDLAALAVALVVGFVAVQAYRVFAPGRNTKKADQVATSAATVQAQTVTVDQQAQAVKQAVDAATDAHKAVVAARDAIDDGVNGRIESAKTMLATDKEPTAAEVAAQIMLDDAQAALGRKLSDADRAYWTKLAIPLIQRQQDALAEAAKQREIAAQAIATRDAVQAESSKKDAVITTQAKELTARTHKATETARVNVKLANQNKAWADDAESWQDRLKAAGWLIVALVAVAAFIAWRLLGSVRFGQDMVALQAHTESIAVEAGHDAGALAAKVKEWWAGDKNEAKAQAIKTNTLRQ